MISPEESQRDEPTWVPIDKGWWRVQKYCLVLRTGTERGSNIKPAMTKSVDYFTLQKITSDLRSSSNQRRCAVMRESTLNGKRGSNHRRWSSATHQSFEPSGSLMNGDLRGTGEDAGQNAVGYQKVASCNLVARCFES